MTDTAAQISNAELAGRAGLAPPQSDSRVTVDCGWGRLIFANTFPDDDDLIAEIRREESGYRDIAFYVRDPHVTIAHAPQDLFLDPSYSYRLDFRNYLSAIQDEHNFHIRPANAERDYVAIGAIYEKRRMVTVERGYLEKLDKDGPITVLVAADARNDEPIGVVFGINHIKAMDDPERGSSLWALAVHPDTPHPAVGEALTRALAEKYKGEGCAYLDLSVMHDNQQAIFLYEKLGFERVPVFTVKARNTINTPLFIGPEKVQKLNPYAQIIVDEALTRGIGVDVLDAAAGYFKLTSGAQSITCRESLSELTSAIAMSRCDDKTVTRKILTESGLNMPAQLILREGDDPSEAGLDEFLSRHKRLVVKPARGEQGAGVSVNLTKRTDITKAIDTAFAEYATVIVEEFAEGEDLRIIVIGGETVAAAIRKPAEIVGTGDDTALELIEKQSRRRAAATGGESRIPLDAETERCLAAAGHRYDDIPSRGERIQVRRTANLHTGGTIHDVTDVLHEELKTVAVRASEALEIPVVGLDLMVPDPAGAAYQIIEANERPGLANHEPQPTAQKFVDFLFPMTGRSG